MFKKLSFFGTALLLAFSILPAPAHSQERYEKFIPFDYRPGLSNKYTALGNIVEVNKDKKTVTIRTNAETIPMK